jgi:hypothetical protein
VYLCIRKVAHHGLLCKDKATKGLIEVYKQAWLMQREFGAGAGEFFGEIDFLLGQGEDTYRLPLRCNSKEMVVKKVISKVMNNFLKKSNHRRYDEFQLRKALPYGC